ncbi:hypothetical protein FH972_011214 [Carpinus fangiana]|uniref:Uncharacterized protein n=1 Tax=Carpinus fangiana TaxID=176857 RepID=A0A660KXN2_9ROSI|nr:hypothetical protein FH972_011214 [Carpinus fangiana]
MRSHGRIYWKWHSYVKDLKTDPKDEFLAIPRATVMCLNPPEKYFEKVLCLAINKRGTDEGALTRVVTTRAMVDMKFIRRRYKMISSADFLLQGVAGVAYPDFSHSKFIGI